MNSLEIITGLMLSCGIADAALLERDWMSNGDGLLTYDSGTGLEWLDLNSTYGVSHNEMLTLLSPGQTYDGFRFATPDELITLLSHAGVSEAAGGGGTQGVYLGEHSQLSAFISLVGGGSVHYELNFTQTTANGHTVEISGTNTSVIFSALSYYDDGRTFFSPRFGTVSPADYNYTDQNAGSWIVRDASVVPIPAAAYLFGSGLLGLIGLGTKKTKWS